MAQQEHSQQASQVKFVPYYGDRMNLVADENYLVFRWVNPDCKVIFSVSQRGEAANIHFDCDKAGARHVKQAIGDFCEFLELQGPDMALWRLLREKGWTISKR